MKKFVTVALMLWVMLPGQVYATEFRLGYGGYDISDTAYTVRTPVEVSIGHMLYFSAGPKLAYTPAGTRFGGIWAGIGLEYRYYFNENLSIRPFIQYQRDLLTYMFDKFFVELFGGTPKTVDASHSVGIELGLTKNIGIAAYYRTYDYQEGRLSDVTGLSGRHEYRGVMLYLFQKI